MAKGQKGSEDSLRISLERGLLDQSCADMIHITAAGNALRVSSADGSQVIVMEKNRLLVLSGQKMIAEAGRLDTQHLDMNAMEEKLLVWGRGASKWNSAEITWQDGRIRVKLKKDEQVEEKEGVAANILLPGLDFVTVYPTEP